MDRDFTKAFRSTEQLERSSSILYSVKLKVWLMKANTNEERSPRIGGQMNLGHISAKTYIPFSLPNTHTLFLSPLPHSERGRMAGNEREREVFKKLWTEILRNHHLDDLLQCDQTLE